MKPSDPVNKLPGIGKIYTKRLAKLKISSVYDLLHHYPDHYQDFSQIVKIAFAKPQETVTIQGTITAISNQYRSQGKSLQKATITDETGQVKATWFNQPFLLNNFKRGTRVSLSGVIETFGSQKIITSPEFEIILPNRPPIHTGQIVAVYPETKGVSSKWLRSRIKTALKIPLKEFLPRKILDQEGLLSYQEALKKIHFPPKKTDYLAAQKRLAFDELFLPQVKAQIKKMSWQKQRPAPKIKAKKTAIRRLINQLPFKLTGAQEKIIKKTLESLEKNVAMNQLLCGDVGSGKTIIAIIAAFTAWQNQLKTLVMAPTEILAKQHYDTFKKFLPEKIKIGLQTGTYQKNLNQADILIGTHALLFKKKLPEDIGLVVIDEQHRFGVKQRSALIKTGNRLFPHVLTMTATPIPRSVALVLHGNLDLSFLNQMPKNRKPAKTWLVPEKKRSSAYDWIKKQIQKNKAQVFIIYPLIEESKHETMKDVKAAVSEYKKLKKTVFADFNLALIHGQIKSNKKNQIIKKFSLGRIDILVATSIVEVGLDIPGATIMVVEGANRFGLAQIHQLRGRIGRNNRQSYCLLFAPTSSGKKSYRRLKILEKTNLGIKLAKLDLKERGPGEVFGTAQHGFPEFKLANLTDYRLVEKTKTWAKWLIKREKMPDSLKKRLEEDKIGQVEPN
ncbi:MAG: ATP-dependent DNA helicase RecG [Patescibacteria group bacterium]|jgi:ATP-dependent DNA helicase RecG